MNEHKRNIIKLIEQASYRHSSWQVFSDFVEMVALSISNSVDSRQYKERELRYLDIIRTYEHKEGELFPQMFAELVLALQDETTDVLGEIFMEMELGSKWKGQFFTPMSVCRMCGAMTVSDMKDKIKELGFITVQEPAVGGGAMVIGLALAMQDIGINYQQSMVVTTIDVDLKAVHMCYIQLSLLGIPAIVCHGNALTSNLDVYSEWKTPAYIIGGWWYRKQKKPQKKIEYKALDSGQLSMVI
jgi:type I restriction-modification system DNA methylase subunit